MHARYTVKDSFYKRAKREGYRARSAYKLEEIERRFAIIKKGDKVLDLGSAPGSWLQVESMLVGDRGLVVGLDILPVAPLPAANVVVRKADIREVDARDLLRETDGAAFDVVTSDIAPNLSGTREVDDARILDLATAVLGAVDGVLRQGGNFLIKLFFSPEFADMTSALTTRFSRVTTFKPKASRGVSSEVYLICTGRR
ncbi:MAG: RlmE family RNA methyltransferase [Syntrophorhabdales bacterium]|jgi:23S rRNA (uridine2552-2'-O)-methyltransferase